MHSLKGVPIIDYCIILRLTIKNRALIRACTGWMLSANYDKKSKFIFQFANKPSQFQFCIKWRFSAASTQTFRRFTFTTSLEIIKAFQIYSSYFCWPFQPNLHFQVVVNFKIEHPTAGLWTILHFVVGFIKVLKEVLTNVWNNWNMWKLPRKYLSGKVLIGIHLRCNTSKRSVKNYHQYFNRKR